MARDAGLAGWVQNCADGRLEACFEGDAAGVDRMVEWCRQGPRGAVVAAVEVHKEDPGGLGDFHVR